MSRTPRDLVYRTLNFDHPPPAPRELWTLPIAAEKYPREELTIDRDAVNRDCAATDKFVYAG